MKTLISVGCDLGDRKSDLCFLDGSGRVAQRARCATTKRGFSKAFRGLAPVQVILEAGTHSAWVQAELEGMGHEVIVANPRRVHLISRNLRKCDEADAELLARLGRADAALLSPIKHRGVDAQAHLAVVKSRRCLLDARTMLVNHARGIVKSFGERLPRCSSRTFSGKARSHLPERLLPALEPVLGSVDELNARIKRLEAEIDSIAESYPVVVALTTITGIGTLTALAFVLTLEDPHRFSRSRTVGAYLGFTPGRRQSGKGDPELGITHAGDTYLRSLLVNCAHYVLGPLNRTDSDLRTWGLELAARRGKAAKKKAIVAVARRLAVMMHRMWITGEVYEAIGHEPHRQAA